MSSFKIDKQELTLPDSWHGVTTGQMIQLKHRKNPQDFCEMLSIFSGVDYKKIGDAQISDLTMQQLAAALEWTIEKIDFASLPLPPVLEFGQTKIKVVQDLGTKTLAQKSYFQQKVFPFVKTDKTDDDKTYIVSIDPDCVPIAIAIYFQPVYTGKLFDPETIDEMIKLCNAIPIAKAFPVASFFLKKYFGLEGLKKNYTSSQPSSSLKQESKTSGGTETE